MPKILIVDDEWLTRLEIEEMLTDLGYDVAGQAETGAEAISKARELNPDLILMDVNMPGGMNGIDAAREIKAELGSPIVFISGYSDPEYIEAAKEIAPFGYVMKPFDEREVHAFIEIALSRRKLELELEKSYKQLEQTNLDLQSEIAARKKTETELQESRKLYRDIFEKNNAMKWLLDPSSGKIIDANPAACEFYQYSHEEITRLRLWDINIEGEANARKLLADANSNGNTEFTFKHRLASGEIRYVQVYTGALESGGKRLLHSIIIDITERKQAEDKVRKAYAEVEKKVEERTIELSVANADLTAKIAEHNRAEKALRESEERYKRVVENALIGICQVEKTGGFIMANQRMAEMFGYDSPENLLSSRVNIADLYVDPEERAMIHQELDVKRSLTGKILRLKKNTGEHFWVKYHARMLRKNGKTIYEGLMEDVTKEKTLTADLERARKMEAIGTLAGGVAHDLNNILGGLVSYPELLLFRLPEDSPLREPILTIKKSGEKAAAVVQDLLTLARRGVVITDVINPNAVIAEYLKSRELENLKSHHPGVHIETRLEADILNILGSSTHLSKTVMNLVSNAAEAMPEGGNLIVSTENRYIDRPIKGYDDVREGDYVVLTISDTGTGIASDDLDKIFEPFFTKKKMGRSGTGLGMAVVWGTVKDHNGYIDIQSAEGEGTTFTLHFPVTRKSIEERSEISLKDYMGKGETILVVDDVEEQRNIASGMLKELGYSVVSVSSGEDAVEYLKANKADLLLLDMIMDPGMDGLDTYKEILELHPGQKALIASGFSETDRVKEAQNLGAITYVRKPFLLEKIGLAVKEELEK